MSERKQYNSLDLAKFIAAVLIVIIHANPFSSYSSGVAYAFRNIIATVAVPFFFVTSGFLFCTKLDSLCDEDKSAYFKKYILRLVTMYLLWSAVYFIFVLIGWIRDGFTVNDLLIYVRDFFFEGSYSTIWFLPALITAISVVYFLRKKFSYGKIVLFAIPFYLFACLGSSYYGLADKLPIISNLYDIYYSFFDTIKNGVLFGWIYVAIGGWFSENNVKISFAPPPFGNIYNNSLCVNGNRNTWSNLFEMVFKRCRYKTYVSATNNLHVYACLIS